MDKYERKKREKKRENQAKILRKGEQN